MDLPRVDHSRRRLDGASLILIIIGIVCGILAYWLIVSRGMTPLVLIPSVVAVTIGATHLVKREAGH